MTYRNYFSIVIHILCVAATFAATYYLIYLQATGRIYSDTLHHVKIIDRIMSGNIYIPHPLWHMLTYYLSKLLNIPLYQSASLFTAFLLTVYMIIIYKITDYLLRPKYPESTLLITLILFVIAPFFIHSFHPYIYIGQGSPSVWHNVTLIMVQPFALLSVFFTIRYFQTGKYSHFILSLLFVIISIFSKPSFIIIFIPSLLLLTFMKRYTDKKNLFFVATLSAVSIILLAYQFLHTFLGDGAYKSHIIFDFLGVWSKSTPNVGVSILLAIGLPLLITLSTFKSIKENIYIQFSWLLVLFALLLFSCFAESGSHYLDGNLGWSWNIALSIIYIFTIIEYFKRFSLIHFIPRYTILALILYQTYVGLFFLLELYRGVAFYERFDSFPFL